MTISDRSDMNRFITYFVLTGTKNNFCFMLLSQQNLPDVATIHSKLIVAFAHITSEYCKLYLDSLDPRNLDDGW